MSRKSEFETQAYDFVIAFQLNLGRNIIQVERMRVNLVAMLESARLDGEHAAGRCSDCGSEHPDPEQLLEHVYGILKAGYAVTAATNYPCHNVIGMEEALGDYFRAHPPRPAADPD